MKKNYLGYTLIELLVVISIIGILAGFGVAKYAQFNRRQIVVQAVQKLKSDLRLAQSKALAGEKPPACSGKVLDAYWVEFSVGSNKIYQMGAKCEDQNPVVKTFPSLPGDVYISSAPSPNPILFKVLAQGTNITGTTSIRLSGYGATETVTITEAGEIK